MTPPVFADYLQQLNGQILERWRHEVRRDPEQFALVHHLDDQELQDHLPGLTAKIINLLRGEEAEDLDEEAARHGRHRRELGYSIIPLLREMQIFRRVLIEMAEEIVGPELSTDEVRRAHELIIGAVDHSMNVSVMQYTVAAEEERNSAQGEARELHGQRDRFLMTLSHELRNQISPILLSIQLLQNLPIADRPVRETVQRIERQARHQSILIDDLLDMSRYRYGKLQLRIAKLDLRMPVRHALETLQGDFTAKRLKLETHLPEQPLVALADETRLAQVVINLLTNAVKFTPAGGAVVVELAQEANVAVLSVRDTGAGISPALLPQLFTMFFQAQPPAPMLKTGLGVGLALAKILTEMHGGKIEAQSEGEGKGATFEIRLPLSEAEDAGEPRFLTNRILIVDDNPDQLHLMAEVLKLRGFEVVAAENAAEALRLVQQHRPRACIIDIGLPDIDGYELARRLRALPATRESRLIAVTGYGTFADRQAFEAAGFDHYFPKPANLDKLLQALSA